MNIRYLSLLLCLLLLAATHRSERSPARKGKDFALFIAVQDYQYWGKLKHPIGEVERIKQELEQNYGFEVEILRNPTKGEIISALRAYSSKAYAEDGQLLIYLSGHGDFDELTKEGFFVPREGQRNDPTQESYLSFSRLQRIVEANPCPHILLAIDACYSGTFDRLVALRGGDGDIQFGRPGSKGSERDRFIARELTLSSRFFIASGKKEQTPDASNFAAYFLRALRSGGRDFGILTMDELVAELKKAQPKPHIATFPGHQRESNFLFIKEQGMNVPPDLIHNAQQDQADWKEAQRSNTAEGYRAYLRKQPKGDFRALAEQGAKAQEVKAREIVAWNTAKNLDTCEGYRAFLREYSNSIYGPLAEAGEKQACRSSVSGDMVRISSGTFDMGCTSEQKDCDSDEKPVTRVTVSDFYLGKHELTLREFKQFIDATSYKTDAEKEGWSYVWTGSWEKKNGVNWRHDPEGKQRPSSEYDHPVIHVSWNDAIAYCNWRSEKEGLTKVYTISGDKVTANWNANGYRLPTEAEWEYAARGGGKAVLFGNGKNIVDPSEINFFSLESAKKPYSVAGNYRGKTVPVGSLNSPNALGLHDMSGNVWEWCWDWYDSGYYAKSNNSRDPRGPDSGSYRVFRGGSWFITPASARVASRDGYSPGVRDNNLGFRLARAVR